MAVSYASIMSELIQNNAVILLDKSFSKLTSAGDLRMGSDNWLANESKKLVKTASTFEFHSGCHLDTYLSQ